MEIEEKKIKALSKLGECLLEDNDIQLKECIHRASIANSWFTKEHINQSLKAIANNYLDENKLLNWINGYSHLTSPSSSKTIGIVAAGNIPLVAMHDFICAYISNNKVKIKLSEKDKILMPFLIKKLSEFDNSIIENISFIDRLKDFDAVIATGSNNTARYFEYYFRNYPHIIRKNRVSIGVLNGDEQLGELEQLGADVFNYFGLGCRNVAQVWLPRNFDFKILLNAFGKFKDIAHHNGFRNNLDYNRAIFLMNRIPLIDCDFLNIIEQESPFSSIASLHYQFYDDIENVEKFIEENEPSLQCVVGNNSNYVPFGKAQSPGLQDYADNIDTLRFLLSL